jgi:hypothetical protein
MRLLLVLLDHNGEVIFLICLSDVADVHKHVLEKTVARGSDRVSNEDSWVFNRDLASFELHLLLHHIMLLELNLVCHQLLLSNEVLRTRLIIERI